MSRPYIDPVRLDLRLFQVTLLLLGLRGEFPKSLQQVILVPLMYLGWGRGGLLGEGSRVAELGENLVPWSNSRDLDIRWKRVMFFFVRGLGVLILGIFPGVVAARGL